jgi:thymidylate synthase
MKNKVMNKADKYYIQNISKIMSEGSWDENPRPKYKDETPAYSKFITQVWEEYDISKGEFPITTLRPTAIKTGIKEILWIYQKQTSSLQVAREMGINWWDEWNIGDDTIGRRYGSTIGKYALMDGLLGGLMKDPFSRRHIMNMYQYTDLNETKGLYPCAYETIWSVRKVDDKLCLDLTLIQRSNDYLVAGYINKIQYVALQMMVAKHCGFEVGKFCHLVQNLHIYDRHFDAVTELLNKEPIENNYPFIELTTDKNFYDYTIDDFKIHNMSGITKINSKLELAI